MSIIHTVASNSTAGTLQWLIARKILEGEVVSIGDMPNLGPLNDGKKRNIFFRNLCFEEDRDMRFRKNADLFKPWKNLLTQLKFEATKNVAIWVGSDGDGYVFLRMACYWLQNIPVGVLLVQPPPIEGYHSIQVYSSKQLAPFIKDAKLISDHDRRKLASEYESIAARPELLRECGENGQLRFLDISTHDPEILSYCTTRWKPVVRVMGEAIGRSDPRNVLSDIFVCGRIQHLIKGKQLEADVIPYSFRSLRIRLPKK